MTKTNKFLFIYGLIMFFAMSLGVITQLNILSSNINIFYIDIFALILLLFTFISTDNFPIDFKSSELLLIICLVIVFIYSMVISIFSNMQLTAIQGSLVLFLGIIFIVISSILINNSTEFFKWAIRIFVTSVAIQLIYNMLPVVMSAGLSFYIAKENAETLVGNSNAISFYFVFLLLYELITRHKFWSIFAVISVIGVIFSMSRAGFVSLFICLILYFLISIINNKIKSVSTYIYLAITIVLIVFVINKTEVGRELLFHLNYGLKATSLQSRDVLREKAFEQFLNYPLGSGVIWMEDPHNIFVRSLRDLGFLIGPLFVSILFFPIKYFVSKYIFKYSKEFIAVLISYVSIMIHSLYEIYYLTDITMFFSMFILIYIIKLKNNQMDDDYAH
ncbi:O-antigen polymerase [Macrococcus capreoli]